MRYKKVTLLSPHGVEYKNENPGLGGEHPIDFRCKIKLYEFLIRYRMSPWEATFWGRVTGIDSPTCSVTKKKGINGHRSQVVLPQLSWHPSYAKCKYGSYVRKFNAII